MKEYGHSIDINCDLGEGFPNDEGIMGFISSANISCAGHAGSIETTRRTVAMAAVAGVRPGAHPGYPDRNNFGRVEMGYTSLEIYGFVMEQIDLFNDICRAEGAAMSHMKMHGALYNRAASDHDLMYRIAMGIRDNFGNLPIYTLAGSVSVDAVSEAGLVPVREAFADRAYNNDMTLVARNMKDAVIEDSREIARRAADIALGCGIRTISGEYLCLEADTICIHGDSPRALETARAIRDAMEREGIHPGLRI